MVKFSRTFLKKMHHEVTKYWKMRVNNPTKVVFSLKVKPSYVTHCYPNILQMVLCKVCIFTSS